jgi:ribosomal protein S21
MTEIVVEKGDIEKAIKKLNRKCQQDLKEVKSRGEFEKPCDRRRRKRDAAQRRRRNLEKRTQQRQERVRAQKREQRSGK